MVTPAFYPYRLEKLVKTASNQNESGNFVVPSGSYEFVCKCRDEKSAYNQAYAIDERKLTKPRSISIYCPKGTPALPPGTTIRVVADCDEVRVSGEVVESESNRLHTVQWL